ncbi:MAG: hypothetical protein ACKPEA_05885 [Planctomycetota bacterium]
MIRLDRSLASLTATAATLAIATASHAVIVLGNGDTINLGTLMGNGSDRTVIVDDKMFVFESFTSSQFNASSFSVIGFVSANVNQWGLRNVGFDLTGPFGDGSPGDGMVHELNLQYNVSILPEWYQRGVRLHDARLTFNGSAGESGSYARVDETIWDLDQNVFLGQLSTYDYVNSQHNTKLVDELAFDPVGYRAFEVNKDLKFFAKNDGDFATASFVRQEFSQVPAPGALALLGMGASIAARRRRA